MDKIKKVFTILEKIDTGLFCLSCNQETNHTITYLDGEIKTIECIKCNKTSGIDKKELLKTYTVNTAEKILAEPFKLNETIKNDGTSILYSLPKRILSKPYRIIKDIFVILEE